MAKKSTKRKARLFVVDGSLTVAWCFPDEKAPYPQAVLDALASATAVVPALWHLEVANALLVGERRGRCSQADVANWLTFLRGLPIAVDEATMGQAWSDTLNLARLHKLSVYDAAYLELALRHGLPLASLDDRLKTAAATAGAANFSP